MHRFLLAGTVTAGVMAVAACSKSNNPAAGNTAMNHPPAAMAKAPAASTNPLLPSRTLPFHAPAFDRPSSFMHISGHGYASRLLRLTVDADALRRYHAVVH